MEEQVLDAIFEALPDDFSVKLYPTTARLAEPEMYVEIDGRCFRIRATEHPHGRCEHGESMIETYKDAPNVVGFCGDGKPHEPHGECLGIFCDHGCNAEYF